MGHGGGRRRRGGGRRRRGGAGGQRLNIQAENSQTDTCRFLKWHFWDGGREYPGSGSRHETPRK